jgi:hypothetical protein
MGMSDMMDRCMDMMGGGMMGNGILLALLMALLLVWLAGLGVVGALIFWGVRKLSGPHARPIDTARRPVASSPALYSSKCLQGVCSLGS